MADEDKEKAEKLAAAKKRFEQLKKEKQKKEKKTALKKKSDKPDESAETKPDESAAGEGSSEVVPAAEEEAAVAADITQADVTAAGDNDESQQSSTSASTKPRATSIKQSSGPLSPQGEVQDLYRKQAARIEELEKVNELVNEQHSDSQARLTKSEEELERLRAGSSELAELKSKAEETDRLQSELTSVRRQLAQAQQTTKSNSRRTTNTDVEIVQAQLASKVSSIESLELELSNLRNEHNSLQAALSERDASSKDSAEKAAAAEKETESVRQELEALKTSIAFPSDETQAANEDPEALTKRITILESDLRTANTSLTAAATRVTSLEQKIETLLKIQRDATAQSNAKDKEIAEFRKQLQRRDKASHVRDASEFELGDEETETGTLQARLRVLEAENFDLRRNVWKEKRADMQPGMNDDDILEYEDVDLNGPYGSVNRQRGSLPRQGSTFQDVLASGISAFTGQSRHGHEGNQSHTRQMSDALLDEDDNFDPEKHRLAQEEQAKARLERVKEIKRGLEKWKGWRVDIAEIRADGIGGGWACGPVFEV